MSEPVWYYARGDVERGPFTTLQIKALANAQKVKRDDLVWKEGMENWMPAKDVVELFPPVAVAANLPTEPATPGAISVNESKPVPSERPWNSAQTFSAETLSHFNLIARVLVTIGAIVLVTTRGCESLGQRRVTRSQALEKSARAAADFAEGAFARGLCLQFGVALLFVGAVALTWFGEQHHRWLGIGLLLVIVLASMTG